MHCSFKLSFTWCVVTIRRIVANKIFINKQLQIYNINVLTIRVALYIP